MKKRLLEINQRKMEMAKELEAEGVTEARMAELEKELDALEKEERDINQRMTLRERVSVPSGRENTATPHEERAQRFVNNGGRTTMNARALLLSSGKIATPTGVGENLNEIYGSTVSSIVDEVYTEDCTGMGGFQEPIITSDVEANEGTTEGSAGTESSLGVDKVSFTPTTFDTLSYVSRGIKKQSPVAYETKTVASARQALRRKASKKIITEVYASNITQTLELPKAIDATTLRKITMSYGGDEMIGSGTLILNKEDLTAFGDVRGKNELKAVYEIIPDPSNENRGVIKDGGTAVPYILNANCNKHSATATPVGTKTMLYGNPKMIKLALWGDYEIATSEDYKFAEGLLAVRGETMADAHLIAKNGFVVVKVKVAQ